MVRKLGVVLFVALMWAAAGCQPVAPAVEPAAAEPVAAEPEATEAPEPEPVAAQPSAAEPIVTGPLRILFLADAYVAENWGYDAHFAAMAAAADPPVEIETQRVTVLSTSEEPEDQIRFASLQGLWETDDVMAAIDAGPWDWVVFCQDLPWAAYALATRPEAFPAVEQTYIEYAAKFAEEVEQAGAQMALIVQWHHKSEMFITVDDMVRINEEAASEAGALVIPVGLAWQRVKQTDPALSLYAQNSEVAPNVNGTYLTAAVLYSAILRRSPEGVAYVPTDILPETGPAAYFRDAWKGTDESVPFLQQTAWETVEEYRNR